MKNTTNANRDIYLDLLRILAAFSVVMLHSAAQFWYSLDIHSVDWIISNSYNAAFRFGVPIFVMISGAIFLNPNYQLNIKRLYTHNILRIIIIYTLWSCAYGLFDCIWQFNFRDLTTKDILREMLSGRYHLWFLPMIAGIYVLLPILKSWLTHATKQNVQYFIFLFLTLQIGIETLRALTVTDELHQIFDLTKVELACGYIGYFIWGYYLTHIGINRKTEKIFIYSTPVAIFANIVLGCLLIWKTELRSTTIYDSFSIFTFVIATSLFLLCKNKMPNVSTNTHKLFAEISSSTFGVYLLHIGLMEFTESLGLHSMMLPNIIGIPLYAIACFIVCLICATILRKIPFIGKYLC